MDGLSVGQLYTSGNGKKKRVPVAFIHLREPRLFFREPRVSGDARLLGRREAADRSFAGFRRRYLHVRRFQCGGRCAQELPPQHPRYVHTHVHVCTCTNCPNSSLSPSVPPSISGPELPRETGVLLNESTQLVCHAAGAPTPTVRWLKDGDAINRTGSSSSALR